MAKLLWQNFCHGKIEPEMKLNNPFLTAGYAMKVFS
jgi:hypothetical protein